MAKSRVVRQSAAQTRRALIDATRRLMQTAPGSASLTVRAIAEEAGLPFSLVTRHFGTRDALARPVDRQLPGQQRDDGPRR